MSKNDPSQDGRKTNPPYKLNEGVPQGGVISPTLFLVVINDIMKNVPHRISRALHADDLAIWHAAENINIATTRTQITLDHIIQWANVWGVEVNASKTVHTSGKPTIYTWIEENCHRKTPPHT